MLKLGANGGNVNEISEHMKKMNKIMMQIPAQQFIITDDNVNKMYGEILASALKAPNLLLLSFLPGEKSKNRQTKQYLEEQMIQNHCNRETLILSLGGGVVGDMAGFIASTYMRGISYVQIPTTLLAMVDSSVGGKTGINTEQGKNLIGTFWQPVSVVVDINCLLTLPQTHIINGLIEALKIFMTNDKDTFNYASHNIDHIVHKDIAFLKNIVERAIKLKVDIVSHDEKENRERLTLNFGHTIGHALEKITDYTLLHGYAVALGILVEAKISQLSGFLSCEEYQVIQSLFFKLNISGRQLKNLKNMNCDDIIRAAQYDKKSKKNTVRYVLLKKLGEVYNEDNIFAYPVPEAIVKKALFEVSEVQHGR
jgi:3-dehydroquinate synthase